MRRAVAPVRRPAGGRVRVRARVLLALGLALLAAGCRENAGYQTMDGWLSSRDAAALTGGDPARGRRAIRQYGCGSCHTIPGIRGASALVGPSLADVARRMYVGGVLPNTPENLVRWIQDPRAVDSQTAMPRVGVTPQDARDIAAYLYMLH